MTNYKVTDYDRHLIDQCTSDHPDHQFIGLQPRGLPCLWTVWCSICEEKGYNRNGRHNHVNPDMSPDYVAAVTDAACLIHLEWERLSAESRAKRRARKGRA